MAGETAPATPVRGRGLGRRGRALVSADRTFAAVRRLPFVPLDPKAVAGLLA